MYKIEGNIVKLEFPCITIHTAVGDVYVPFPIESYKISFDKDELGSITNIRVYPQYYYGGFYEA